MPILSVKNLSVVLEGVKILDDITFQVQKGEIWAIIGPNGAGKTVLFRALLNLIPWSGVISWQPEIKIGYVPQRIDFDRHLPLSLEDFLMAKIKVLKIPKEQIFSNLELVGFSQVDLQLRLGALSFGQLQKALILFALLGDPDVLLLDEPTLGMAIPYEGYIYQLIHHLQKERNLTVLLISHEVDIVYRYADKVLCLNREMLCSGAPQETLTDQTLSALYKEGSVYYHHHQKAN
jgi:zinc transport system ATP-binding protein